MANFLDKSSAQAAPQPGSFYRREQNQNQTFSSDKKPIRVGASAPGEVQGVGISPDNPEGLRPEDFDTPQAPKPNAPPPPQVAPALQASDKVGELLKNGSLASHPLYQKLQQDRAKLITLKTMPTYANKKGEVVQGMKDRDGRARSGLKGLIQGLADNFSQPVRDEADLYARLGGAITRGVGGAIVPEWNEWADRNKEIQKLEAAMKTDAEQLEFDSKMMTQDVARTDKVADNQRNAEQFQQRNETQNRSLDIRASRAKVQNMRDEQKTVVEPIFKRGYYYEGDNPAEDAALAKLGIVMPDFDNTRKQIKDNGINKSWNPEKREYEQAAGTEADPDDAPITFMLDGEKVTTSRKYFVNYKAQKEGRESQQAFTATENDKNRAIRREEFIKQFNYKIEQDARSGALKKIDLLAKVNRDYQEGNLDKETYDLMISTLNKY